MIQIKQLVKNVNAKMIFFLPYFTVSRQFPPSLTSHCLLGQSQWIAVTILPLQNKCGTSLSQRKQW